MHDLSWSRLVTESAAPDARWFLAHLWTETPNGEALLCFMQTEPGGVPRVRAARLRGPSVRLLPKRVDALTVEELRGLLHDALPRPIFETATWFKDFPESDAPEARRVRALTAPGPHGAEVHLWFDVSDQGEMRGQLIDAGTPYISKPLRMLGKHVDDLTVEELRSLLSDARRAGE